MDVFEWPSKSKEEGSQLEGRKVPKYQATGTSNDVSLKKRRPQSVVDYRQPEVYVCTLGKYIHMYYISQ